MNLFNSAGSTDIVADVAGWFGAEDMTLFGARFTSVVPARILDTRVSAASLAPGSTMSVEVAGQGGIPPGSEASAVVLNITVTGPATDGWLTVWPANTPRPLASNLNYAAGQTVPNLVVVPLDAGHINIYSSGRPVDVVADVAGWYSG